VFKNKALFHEVGDYERLTKNIEQYYSTPEIIPRYRKACQEMIRNNYSSVIIDHQLKDLFSSI
jgi:cobalamin biosynthesis Mg chelatase CobN